MQKCCLIYFIFPIMKLEISNVLTLLINPLVLMIYWIKNKHMKQYYLLFCKASKIVYIFQRKKWRLIRHSGTSLNIYVQPSMLQKLGINLINDRLGVFNMAKNQEYLRKPEWLKIKINTSDSYKKLKKLMREKRLNTVCEEARCPNLHECWS